AAARRSEATLPSRQSGAKRKNGAAAQPRSRRLLPPRPTPAESSPTAARRAGVGPWPAVPDFSEVGGRRKNSMTEVLKFGDIEIRVHSAAAMLPMMSDDELDELSDDIAKHGLEHPLVWYIESGERVLLDGRNRVAAVARIQDQRRREEIAADIRLGRISVSYDGKDPYAYVISANLHRRHLTIEKSARLPLRC